MYKLFIYMLLLTTLNTVYANSDKYRLYVDVFPEEANADIYIWNIKPKFRQGIELKKGFYDLRVKAKGYHTWHKWINLKDDDVFEQVDLVTLDKPKPDTANITDDEPPEMNLLSMNPEVDIHENLHPAAKPIADNYVLTIKTIPSDSNIKFLDEELIFEQDMLLPPGKYKLRVSRRDYVSQEHEINIIDDDVKLNIILVPISSSTSTLSLKNHSKPIAIPIPKKKFILNLNVKPADAIVKILGTNQLYSPNMALTPGKYVIRVEKQGYVTRRELVEIIDQDINKTIELSPPPMCFYGESQKRTTNDNILYYYYSVRLNFYHNFVEVHYYVQIMPSGATSHYEFKGIRNGDDLELIGLLRYENDTQEELKTQMSLKDGKLIEAINGNRQVLQPTPCN